MGAPSHPKTTATPLLPDSDGHVHQHCDTRPNPWFSQATQRTSYPQRGHTPIPTERGQQKRNGRARHRRMKGLTCHSFAMRYRSSIAPSPSIARYAQSSHLASLVPSHPRHSGNYHHLVSGPVTPVLAWRPVVVESGSLVRTRRPVRSIEVRTTVARAARYRSVSRAAPTEKAWRSLPAG